MPLPDRVVICDGDRSFDHYSRLVCRVLDVPASVVSIVEPRRQVFAGAVGLAEPYATTRETPLSHSFCKYVVQDGLPLVVSDARTDARVAHNPAVSELDVIAYAGWPVVLESGRAVGSLCAIDSRPRDWTEDDLAVLADLAQACSAELQQSQRAVVAGESLTREIFASVDVAMAFYDNHGQLLLANELAVRRAEDAGFSLDQPPFAGDEVRAADNQTRVPHDEQLIPRALRGEHGPSPMHWVGPPGKQVAMIGSSRPVLHPDGSRWGTLVVGQDVTSLARALRVKDDFISTVSHELRTPLTSIIGYLEMVVEALPEAPGSLAGSLQVIERNAQNLQRRIGELLDIGDRRRLLDTRPADVAELVGRVATTFGEQARAAGVDLCVDACGSCWADVDAGRLEQVVENLASNALKYSSRGGRVDLSVSGAPDSVTIEVRDEGVGMTADEVSQAFDLFWRAGSAQHAAVQGLGIGLSFVHDVVEAHGGTTDIVSRPGGGTTVTVVLGRERRPGVTDLA